MAVQNNRLDKLLIDRGITPTLEKVRALFCRNFVAALAVLLPFKFALVLNNIFGTEGFAPGPALAAKSLLFYGNDILGAVLVAALAAAVSWPLVAIGKVRIGHTAAITLQSLHGAIVAISFFTTLYIGGPLNREVIELSSLVSNANAESGAGGAMWSSIARYIGPLQIGGVLAGIMLPIVAYILQPGIAARLGCRTKMVMSGTAAIEAALTALLLPWLINGHILHIRMHTYGLERSPGLVLAGSYVKPLFAGLGSAGAAPADPFIFDFSPIETEGYPSVSNPLRGAIPKRTNVILVSLESVSAVYSDADKGVMPFVRGAGSRPGSVYLSRYHSVWPQTMKSLFSVFCSELPYPYYQSITAVNPAIPCVSLSEVLHAQGYETALITSADLAYDRQMRFFQHRAFDHVADMRSLPWRQEAWGNSWGVEETVAVRHILAWAAQKRDEPFFVFYQMITGHHPYNACLAHEQNPLDEYHSYLRSLRYIDDRVRDISEGLKRLGIADNTLLVVISDHGEAFAQHPGSIKHGAKVWDEIVRVPAMLEGPQLKGVSGTVKLPTSHVDLAPTILGLLGIDAPYTMKGRNLVASDEPRVVLFGGRPPGAQRGLVDGRWKYIEEENGPQMLFDLETDTAEQVNRISGREKQAARYHERLNAWRAFSENLIENYTTVLRDRSITDRK